MRYADVAKPIYTPNVRDAVSMGVASGCPFCRGRMVSVPTPGSKIQILASYRSGWIGTVTPKDTWLDGEEFCVRFDHDPPRVTQRVLLRHDLFVSEPFVDPPCAGHHYFEPAKVKDVDGRDKPGHDED